MVEQYLDGPQVSTESIVIDGRCFTPGFSDRNYEYLERYAPFFIENGGDLPSHLPEETQAKVRDAGRAGGEPRWASPTAPSKATSSSTRASPM